MDAAPDHEVAVIGAGFSGIGAAIKLDEAGFRDFVVLEEGDGVGGAWHWNTYPGVAVDIPSFSYQFSFEKRSDWSRVYAPGRELKAYAEHCVRKYGVGDRIRFGTKVKRASFDEDANLWRIEIAGGGTLSARYVVGATGVFSQPKLPDIPGIETFAGPTIHTARWDHSVDISGQAGGGHRDRRLGDPADPGDRARGRAPDGLPAHADLVPAEARRAARRPRARRAAPAPGRPADHALAQPGVRGADVRDRRALRRHVSRPARTRRSRSAQAAAAREDPGVRDKLTPRYGLGCKRPSFSNEYIPAFNRPNVQLETAVIEAITPAGVRTADGVEHELDVLACATGFKVFDRGNMPPFSVAGVGGLGLEEWWSANRMQAYEGVSVPGFPNWFSILGPYGFNGQSYFGLIETQMRHIVRCLRRARSDGATRVEVRPEANRRYFESVLARRHNQIFFQGSCANSNSYYFDEHGDVPFRPALTLEAAWRASRFDLDDYDFAVSPSS